MCKCALVLRQLNQKSNVECMLGNTRLCKGAWRLDSFQIFACALLLEGIGPVAGTCTVVVGCMLTAWKITCSWH